MNYKTLTKDDEVVDGDEVFNEDGWVKIQNAKRAFRISSPYRRPIPEGWIPISEARKYGTIWQAVVFSSSIAGFAVGQMWTGFFDEAWRAYPNRECRIPTHFQVLSSTIHPKQSDFEEAYQRLEKKHQPSLEGPMKDFLRELWEEARK